MMVANAEATDTVHTASVIDVRTSALGSFGDPVRDQIVAGMSNLGTKWPSAVLFDEQGLKIYDAKVTQAPEYYPFAAETSILQAHADDIVNAICSRDAEANAGRHVVELGSGSLSKTALLLSAFARQLPQSTRVRDGSRYYALDLDRHELVRTLGELDKSAVGLDLQGKMSMVGLWGTFDDGLRFIATGGLGDVQGAQCASHHVREEVESESCSSPDATPVSGRPLHMLFIGTSISNFEQRDGAAAFLKSLPLRPGSSDTLLLGMDQNDSAREIELAYNDPKGLTREFILNGLRCAGRILGDEGLFDLEAWECVGEYNRSLRRYEFHYESLRNQTIVDPATGTHYSFRPKDRILAHVSHKFSAEDARNLFFESHLRPVHQWTDEGSRYSVWLLERPVSRSIDQELSIRNATP
ncbi:histidine-specific methyltransferase [Trametes punicea]|nr:histidine-specific methyltransferase [Trametes punicea]